MKRGLAVILATGAALAATTSAQAADVVRTASANPKSPIAAAVSVPADHELVFLSGALPTLDKAAPGDTRSQTADALGKLKAVLAGLGLSFADVVKANVFLVGDPAKGGEIDFAGLNAAWTEEFGTAAQPNKPARSTVKVAGLVAPGALVEIEVIAARRR